MEDVKNIGLNADLVKQVKAYVAGQNMFMKEWVEGIICDALNISGPTPHQQDIIDAVKMDKSRKFVTQEFRRSASSHENNIIAESITKDGELIELEQADNAGEGLEQ